MPRRCTIALFSVLSAAVICFIFSNSLPDIAASDAQSSAVADFLRPFLDPMHRIPDETFHHLIRKLAHFTEFFALGVCLSGLSVQFERKRAYVWGTPMAASVLVAMADEGLQFFTGRGNAWQDVLLDSTGAVCGVLVTALVCRMIHRHRTNRSGT